MGLLRGAADGERAARAPTTCSSRVFKDIYPRFRRCAATTCERKGGWDCHGLPVEIAVEQQLGITSKAEIEALRHRASSTQRCRESVFTYVEDWNRADRADRLLARPRRRLPDARRRATSSRSGGRCAQIWDKGLLYEGHKVVPYCPRCGTALSLHEVALGYRDVVDPSIYVRFPVTRGRRPAAGRRRAARLDDDAVDAACPTSRSPSIPSSTYVRAKARTLERLSCCRGARRAGARRATPRSSTASPAPRSTASATSRRSATISGERVRRARPHRPARRLRHHRGRHGHRAHRARVRRGRLPRSAQQYRPRPVVNPVRLDGTYDERARRRYAGRFVKDADRDLIDDLARARPAAARRGVRALLPALLALRHAAALLRQAVLVHRDVAAARPRCSRPTRRSTGTRSTSSTGASATGWRTTSTGRCRASATGARRCRCGAARTGHVHVRRLVRRARGALGRAPARTCTARTSTTSPSPARSAREPHAARRPRSSTSGSTRAAMPFAQYHYPFEHEDALRGALPRRLHLRGARPDARLVLLAARGHHAAVRPRAVPQRRLPRADPRRATARRCRSPRATSSCPWDVLDRYGADAFRWYFFTSKQPWDGYRFSDGDDRRGRAAVPQAAVEHLLLPRRCTRTQRPTGRRSRRTADRARPLGPLARWPRTVAEVDRAPRRLRRDVRRAGRSRRSSTTSPTGTCAARARRFWDGDPAAFATLRECLLTVTKLLAPFTPFVADEIYDNLDGGEAERAPRGLARGGRRGRATSALEADMAVARETVRLGLSARAAGEGQGPPAAARGRRGRRRARARGASRRTPTSCARSSTSRRCASWPRPTSSAPTSSRPTTARSARASARQMPQVGGRDRRARSRPRRRRAARGPPRRRQRRRARPRAAAGRPDARAAAAGGLPARARGLARRRARPRGRRGAAARGPGARGRARGAERAQGGGSGGRGPHRADARPATRSCSPRPAPTRPTWPARRSRWPSHTTARRPQTASIEGRDLHIGVTRA